MDNEHAARARSHHRDQARAFLMSRLRKPRALDLLAHEVHARLQMKRTHARAWLDYRSELWRLFARTALLATQKQITCRLSEELEQLKPHIERAQLRLPSTHARVLSAAKRERSSLRAVATAFGMSEQLAQQYLSQALALMRTLVLQSIDSDCELVAVSRREILSAQEAAYWITRGTYDRDLPTEELAQWLRTRALHVREFLIAWQWNDVLDSI